MSYTKKKWYKPEKLLTKIIFTVILLLFIRICSNIPIPLINREYLKTLFDGKDSIYSLLNSFSGGAFTNMTFMAVGVTPYITSSIILQLLTVAFPKLKDSQKDGITGQKKWEIIQIVVGLSLGALQSIGFAITFGKQGLLTNYNIGSVALLSLLWTIGSGIAILIGEYITKCCIGNGISLILAINIISELPSDLLSFYELYIKDQNVIHIILSSIIFITIIMLLITATIILNNAQKEIPVIYSKSISNNSIKRNSNKVNSSIPIKLNAAGVMPIIFTSTIFSLPIMFLSNSNNKIAQAIVHICSSTYWFDLENWWRTLGLVIYAILVVCFAYFYTSIQFNTFEIAQNLKKQGACIPGIRPGKPTVEYLNEQFKYITFYGAIFLFVLTQIPTIICHFTNMNSLSFGGTSIIIIVSVIQETTITIKSELMTRNYLTKKGTSFLGIRNNAIRKGAL